MKVFLLDIALTTMKDQRANETRTLHPYGRYHADFSFYESDILFAKYEQKAHHQNCAALEGLLGSGQLIH